MDHRKTLTDPKLDVGYYGIANNPSASSSTDADAEAYFMAAGITNAAEKAAVTTFVKSLKTANLWEDLIYVMPISPTSLSAAFYNVKTATAASNQGFSSGDHTSSGLSSNGNRFMVGNEYNFNNLPAYDFHCSAYVTGLSGLSSDQWIMGYYASGVTSDACIRFKHSTTSIEGGFGEIVNQFSVSPGAATTGGFYLFNVDSNTVASIVLNNGTPATQTGSKNDLGTINTSPSNSFPMGGAYNQFYGASAGVPGIYETFTAGFRLSTQQKTDLYNAVLAYNTALGRN